MKSVIGQAPSLLIKEDVFLLIEQLEIAQAGHRLWRATAATESVMQHRIVSRFEQETIRMWKEIESEGGCLRYDGDRARELKLLIMRLPIEVSFTACQGATQAGIGSEPARGATPNISGPSGRQAIARMSTLEPSFDSSTLPSELIKVSIRGTGPSISGSQSLAIELEQALPLAGCMPLTRFVGDCQVRRTGPYACESLVQIS